MSPTGGAVPVGMKWAILFGVLAAYVLVRHFKVCNDKGLWRILLDHLSVFIDTTTS